MGDEEDIANKDEKQQPVVAAPVPTTKVQPSAAAVATSNPLLISPAVVVNKTPTITVAPKPQKLFLPVGLCYGRTSLLLG